MPRSFLNRLIEAGISDADRAMAISAPAHNIRRSGPEVGEIRTHAATNRAHTRTISSPSSPTRSLTAAAAVLTSSKMARTRGSTSTADSHWQQDAWRFYDITPELAYVTRFEAAAMSRAVLTAARLPDDPQAQPEVVTDASHPAHMAMSEFLGGRNNASQEIARIDTHMTVPGETWICAFDDPDTSLRRWASFSNSEVSNLGNDTWRLTIDGEHHQIHDRDLIMIRVWNMNGQERWMPDSPVRHLIPVLAELEGLTKHVAATIDSRLAGAGLLLVPSEMSFQAPEDEDKPDGVSDFAWALIKIAQESISNRDSASALVPLIGEVAGEFVDKIRHVKFWGELDAEARPLREEAIRRVALGLDIPPEVLLGLSDANHWTSWQIEESSIKLHLEPKLQTICHAATIGWLHPYLQSMGVEDWDSYIAWYDVTQIKLRPNRSTDAKDLHDDGLIDDQARRLASGFDENDAPEGEQFTFQMLRKAVSDQPQILIDPNIGPAIASILFPDLPPINISPVQDDPEGDPIDLPETSNLPQSSPDTPTPESRERDSRVEPDTVDRQ